MKAWKKGAILGGLWGLISGIVLVAAVENFGVNVLMRNICFLNPAKICTFQRFKFSLPYILKFIFVTPAVIGGSLTLFVTKILSPSFFDYTDACFHYPILFIPHLILSILIGALIGSVIGFAVEKYKEKRSSK